jgi:hypothetical protein
VLFGPQKHIENQVTLSSTLQPLLTDVLKKYFLFLSHRWSRLAMVKLSWL